MESAEIENELKTVGALGRQDLYAGDAGWRAEFIRLAETA